MSLVGNMEDLGIGEILQIVSLSRRSGLLLLKSRGREARIIFQNGQVTWASSTAVKQKLGETLIHKGAIDLATLKRALSIQAQEGHRQLLGTVLAERFEVSAEAIETAVGEQIENVIYSVFAWAAGNFQFEMQEVTEGDAAKMESVQFMLKRGLNPQFLAMEGARIMDEKRHRGEWDEESEAADATGPAPDSELGLPPPKASASPEPAAQPPREEIAQLFSTSLSRPVLSIEVTAWLVMALGWAVLAYGLAGLVNYYSRDWQAVLSGPFLLPVSKSSVFFRFGFIPWTVTLFSLYLLWAAHRFWRVRKDSLSRLIEGAWSGIAVVAIYEVVEFCNWLRLASSTPTISFYAIGVVGSLFGAVLLSAPFAVLLLHLKSEVMSREVKKTAQMQNITAYHLATGSKEGLGGFR